jgi:type IV secretion system protein VirD4
MQNAVGNIGQHSLLMVIDEMPALGYMKQIEQILTYGRGYGVRLMAISQTIELIKGVYPKSWETNSCYGAFWKFIHAIRRFDI